MQTKLLYEEMDPESMNKVAPSEKKNKVNSDIELAKMSDSEENSMSIEELKIIYQTKKEEKAKNGILFWKKELDGCIWKTAITSDSKYLISADSSEESIRIFDLQAQKLYHRFKDAHKESILSLAVSPDNKYIISGSQDKSIKIFDIENKKVVHHFQDVHEDQIKALAVTPDNKFIVSGSDDQSIKLFDLHTKQEVHHFKDAQDGWVTSMTVTSDSRFVISGSHYNMKIHDLQTKQQVHSFEDLHPGAINAIVVTNDDKLILSASGTSIKINDFSTKQQLHHFRDVHQDDINSLALTPDNKFIVSGSSDKSIKVFDLETKNQVSHFQNAHEDNVTSVAVTSDNKYILSGSYDCSLKVFYFHVKQEVHNFENIHEHWIRAIAVTPDNKYIISSSDDKSIIMHDLKTKQPVHHWKDVHQDMVLALAVTRDNKYLVSGSTDKTINIFDLRSKEPVYRFENVHQKWLSTLAVTPDGKFIVSAGSDENGSTDIKLFDMQTKQQVHHFQNAHQDWIPSITITSDSKLLISSSSDKSIKIFDLQTKQQIYHFQNAHLENILAIALSSDDKFIVSISADSSIKVFDFRTKQQTHHFQNAHTNITSLALSSDNRFIITGSHDQCIKIFDIHTKQQVHHYYQAPGKCYISALAVTSDNRYLLCSTERSVKMFDLYTKPPSQEPEFPKRLLSGGKDVVFEPFQRLSIQDPSIFDQEFYFIYNGIKQLSTFNSIDNFLFEKAAEYSISQANKYLEFFVLPFRWTSLHLVSVYANHDFIAQMPEYSEFKMPFLLDAFNRTPFHYLIAHRNMNYITVNILFKYVCDYLEDCSSKDPFEFQQIVESLSPLLPLIFQKIDNKSRQRFFLMVYTKSSAPHSDPAPLFGQSSSDSAFFSDSPVLTPFTRDQIWDKQGTTQIEFRSHYLYLDYDILSQDMNQISECLKTQTSEEFFKIPAITKLIDHLWQQAETPLMIFFAFYSMFIIALSVYLTLDDGSLVYELPLLAISVLLTLNEFWQLFNLKTDYLVSPWNWLDLAHLLLTSAFLITRITNNENELARAWISTFIVILGYIRWISLLKIFQPTRNLIQVVLTVVKDMVSFIVVIALIIIGFSVIFLVFNREDKYGAYLYQAYNVLYGPMDIGEDAAWPFSQKLIMAVLAFFLNVVLLNLLISIMGDSYGQVLAMRAKTDSLTRLEMISEAAVYKKFLKPEHQTRRGFLVDCMPVELNEDESSQNAELENVMRMMMKLIQKNNAESKQEIQTLKDKVEENNLRVETAISNLKTEIFTYFQSEFSKINSIKQPRNEEIQLMKDVS